MVTEPPRAAGRRISWRQVPDRMRRAVEAALGAAVVESRTEAGGFSPGLAARLRLANGGTAFVKALGVDLHAASVELYRSEAAAMLHLPAGLPVPRLLEVYDDGEWVALLYEEVEGTHPALPWRQAELERVAAAVDELSAALRPSPWPEAPSFAEANRSLLEAVRELAAAPPPHLDARLQSNLEWLADQETPLAELVRGEALLHGDIRSDNLLLTPSRGVVFLDWAWTCNGAPWLDLAFFAVTVNAEGGADVEQLLCTHPLTREVDRDVVDAVLLALAVTYWTASEAPEPLQLPGIRSFQRAYAEATLRWLQRRRVGR